ncbi:MAG: hypothetical protein NWF00_10040, partial [Candidatus Bathyarchaeota archaeon]|nr:hypothetical protein [Candidatus Bathyarchaeota archaeon]
MAEMLIHKDPPQELIRIMNDLYADTPVIKQVIFDTNITQLQGHMAAFVPGTGTIAIDLAACANDLRWMEKGALYVPNVWFNMMYCMHHEYAHARQTMQVGWDNVSLDVLEDEADGAAIASLTAWADHGGKVPKLTEMGWVAEHEIREFLNKYYVIKPEVINDEIDALDSGAVAL